MDLVFLSVWVVTQRYRLQVISGIERWVCFQLFSSSAAYEVAFSDLFVLFGVQQACTVSVLSDISLILAHINQQMAVKCIKVFISDLSLAGFEAAFQPAAGLHKLTGMALICQAGAGANTAM